MMLCEETLTLVHPTRTRDGESYACTVIEGASWHGKAALSLENSGLKATDTVHIRLPVERFGGMVRVGDWLVRGRIETVAVPEDFAGETFCKVLSVSDNRRGFQAHWAVTGA